MSSAAPVRSALRTATRDVHERLHGARPFAEIAAGRLDREGYVSLLSSLHLFHGRLEAACGAIWGTAARSPDRIARIEADLDHFGASAPRRGGGWMPPPGDGAALGALYVAQGSTLGGRVIHRQLDYLLPGADGRRFFAASAQDGARWRSLCAQLEQEGRTRLRLDSMIAGAQAAFDLFEHCLEPEPVDG